KPGGEIKKIDSEPSRFGIFKCDHHFRCRLRAEKHFMQTFLGCDDVIGGALVGRKIADQLQNDRDVCDGGITNLKSALVHFLNRKTPDAFTTVKACEMFSYSKIADVAVAVPGGKFFRSCRRGRRQLQPS